MMSWTAENSFVLSLVLGKVSKIFVKNFWSWATIGKFKVLFAFHVIILTSSFLEDGTVGITYPFHQRF